MPGKRTSEIRREFAQLLIGTGWTPSTSGFVDIGRDRGSRTHKSFVVHAPSRVYKGRQSGPDVHTETTVEIRALVSSPHDAMGGGHDLAEDLAEDLAAELLLSVHENRVRRLVIQPHAAHPRIHVVTLTVTVLHVAYTPDLTP